MQLGSTCNLGYVFFVMLSLLEPHPRASAILADELDAPVSKALDDRHVGTRQLLNRALAFLTTALRLSSPLLCEPNTDPGDLAPAADGGDCR
jgi:hypothetical protein